MFVQGLMPTGYEPPIRSFLPSPKDPGCMASVTCAAGTPSSHPRAVIHSIDRTGLIAIASAQRASGEVELPPAHPAGWAVRRVDSMRSKVEPGRPPSIRFVGERDVRKRALHACGFCAAIKNPLLPGAS